MISLLAAGLLPWPALAVNPPPETEGNDTATVNADAVTRDQYGAYLRSVESRDETCRRESRLVQELLAARAGLTARFATASGSERSRVARELVALDARLGPAEAALEKSLATTKPSDAPGYVLPAFDIEEIRKQAIRHRHAISLPVPPAPRIPALPATAAESQYIGYLTVCAGDAEHARRMVRDVTYLLGQRRELAFRHSQASAAQRKELESLIHLVSLHVRTSVEAALGSGNGLRP